MHEYLLWTFYATPLAIALALYTRSRRTREEQAQAIWEKSLKTGLTEPVSIHPVVDPTICVGSGSCVRACPEQTLGIVMGKASMVNPTVCIGHGACAASCPVEAITLVLGTERRGVDIPQVKPSFETNVPGIFVAGELGGMGLIRKAAEQGRQAIDTIRQRRAVGNELDVIIVGAGPAGLSAALACIQHKLRYTLIEQEDSLGGTIFHYPRNKVVLTQPVNLALVGRVRVTAVSKESLLEFWQGVVAKHGVEIRFGERVDAIRRDGELFEVKSAKGTHQARSVLLAVGRRGTPRKLEVPGEEQPKVVYRLIDANQYAGKHVLVVGGGDSAVEAALALAAQGTPVALSYRGDVFNRLKPANRERLESQPESSSLNVLLRSSVKRITADEVVLERDGKEMTIPNDAVIVCAGGILPMKMLKDIGVMIETKYGKA